MTVLRCDENWGANNRSAGCQVRFGNSKLLLMGDCGNQALEYFLAHRDHALLECDIMKVTHHGINGVVPAFLNVAQPELLFVPNTTFELKQIGKYDGYMSKGALLSGDGTLTMETDGIDWYVWQEPNTID